MLIIFLHASYTLNVVYWLYHGREGCIRDIILLAPKLKARGLSARDCILYIQNQITYSKLSINNPRLKDNSLHKQGQCLLRGWWG